MRHLVALISLPLVFACKNTDLGGSTTLASLEGVGWKNSCVLDSGSVYYHLYLQFSGGSYVVQNRFASDSSCSTLTHRADLTGYYSLSGSQNMDLTSGTTSMTMLTAAQVTLANNTAYCGFTNWTLNVAKDVTGLDCGNWSFNPAGMNFYDIWKVENNQFYMGASDYTYDGLSPATRPITFTTSPYVAQ